MYFRFRNVNDAFYTLVKGIYEGTIPTVVSPSRVGEVRRVEQPVMVTYTHPQERVLFNQVRDCNPFFHLFESLWMLAGRNDVFPLTYYNPQMRLYSDDGNTLHGAYGYRWRHSPTGHPRDQLRQIVSALRKDPTCRRQVLSIWCNQSDLGFTSKDLPCNTHVYFSVRPAEETFLKLPEDSRPKGITQTQRYLDMTVCNRSNDLIWGMLGANVVHFSMLQEYMAACIGVQVGIYHQMTNNLHVYTERWEPEKWLAVSSCEPYAQLRKSIRPSLVPLVEDPERFDRECAAFIDGPDGDYQEPFLRDVALPMCVAFRRHKRRCYLGDDNALRIMERVQSDDWRIAGTNWLLKRKSAWEAKSRVKDGNPYTARELPRQSAARIDEA